MTVRLFLFETLDRIPAEFAEDQATAEGGSFRQQGVPVFGAFPEHFFHQD